MTTADALTAAVIASPDDDLPRLVYADWYDENGDPERAEFIRLQCTLARPDGLPAARLIDLRIREKVLLGLHSQRWLEPLRKRGEPLFSPRTHGQFRRGFVEVVWMPAAWFTKKADKLFDRCPVRELRVTLGTNLDFFQLMQLECTARLETLDLSDRKLGNIAGLVVVDFTRRDPPTKLNRLRMRACEINDAGAERLLEIEERHFAPLELDLSLNPISPAAVHRLRQRYGPALRFE